MICKVVYVLLILTAAPSSSLAVIPIIGNGLILAVLFSFYIAYTHTHLLYTHTMIKIWSMKAKEAAAEKKKPKTSAAQIRVQKGICNLLVQEVHHDLTPLSY